MDSNPVVFLHVPKTGGTTMNFILNHIYKMKFLWLRNDIILKQSNSTINEIDIFHRIPPEKRIKFKAFAGHKISPLIDQLPSHFKKLMLVRNPYEQIPSLYFHHQRNKSDSPAYKEVSSYATLDDFVKSESKYYPNPQVKSLFFDDLEILKNQDLMKEKIATLVADKIDICGTTEQFEDFLAIVSYELNWGRFSYQIKNQKPGTKSTVPEKLKVEITQRNGLDIFLYEQVAEKFQLLIEKHQSKRNFKARNTSSVLDKVINKIQQYKMASMANLELKKEVQLKSTFLKYFLK